MVIAGIMSGTSADGIDVALTQITGTPARVRLIAHKHFPYPRSVRDAILFAMNAKSAAVADLARLNVRLGQLYADAVIRTMRAHRKVRVTLIGMHGQTIYHQGAAERFLGSKVATTWQSGEAAIVAARTGLPVVSDFRPSDMALGGQGAPLVPFFDFTDLRHPKRGRILLNLGGIANVTAIPPRATLREVTAFDTGPAGMVIDDCMMSLFNRPMDYRGRVAAQGTVLEAPLERALDLPYFAQRPPKSAGREEFGREFSARFIRSCGSARRKDIIATATALTVASITQQLKRFILRGSRAKYLDVIAAGGGTRNRTLMKLLSKEFSALGLTMQTTEQYGVPSQAKEAMAFALLAYETWRRRPSNVPRATGASRPAILGKITHI